MIELAQEIRWPGDLLGGARKEKPSQMMINPWDISNQTSSLCRVRTDLRERTEIFLYSVTILNDSFINSEGIS